ncbi:MAG: hypothetical protein IAF08_08725 [Rhizobacter sp.]|nr:hypothetical protein [Chlorobiales bacterium]
MKSPALPKNASSPRAQAIRVLKQMDDAASFEDMMYELYVLQKITRGLAEADAGKTTPHAEVKRRLQKKFKPHA